MVDAVHNMDGANTTKEANTEIGEYIDATAAEIAEIQSVLCE